MTQKNGIHRKNRSKKSSKHPVTHLLDSGTLADIKEYKQITAQNIEFAWNHYSELAGQRNLIEYEIKQSLIQTCIPFEMEKWQRAVKYKYSLHPLSTAGSVSYVGGRFNTGKEVNSEVPVFPALYLAEDKDTALQEHLAQVPTVKSAKLTPRELALTNPSSETIVSVNGRFDKIFDLRNAANLKRFVELTKGFRISKELTEAAKKLNHKYSYITTPKILQRELLIPDWRLYPAQYDVPANSQIFGHLVYSAGIEGILYCSKFTKKLCIAIFPRNFVGTESFVYLVDAAPHSKVPIRLDANNWRMSEMGAEEIFTVISHP